MTKRGILFVLIALLIFGIASVVADFTYNSNKLIKDYRAGETIRGKVDISFDNENAESLFTSNFPGNITLLELLNLNGLKKGIDYNCSTNNCGDQYSTKERINSASISVSGEKVVGLRISGSKITEVESVKLGLQSNIGGSCSKQLEIDILNDGKNFIVNDKYTNNTCFSKNYGCFNPGLGSYQEAIISGSDAYCEKIDLLSAPAYKLGARIKNRTSGKSGLKMQLYSIERNLLEECGLPGHVQNEEDLECIVNYSSSVQNTYFVCVIANQFGADYKIRTETNSYVCGTDNLGDTFTRDYEIFARSMEFDRININIDDNFFSNAYGDSLSNYIYEYILANYDLVCKPECVIPIKFLGQSQTLSFNNVNIVFKDGNTRVSDTGIYNIEKESAKINSKGLELDLEAANFAIPIGSKAKIFELKLNGKDVFSEGIRISESFDFSLDQRFVFFGRETEFNALSNQNITASTWDFGDGTVKESSGKSVRYRYREEEEFNLKVTLIRNDDVRATKTFKIKVGNPREAANLTILEYRERITKIENQTNSFNQFVKREIEDIINIGQLNASLSNLENRFNNATYEEDFVDIMNGLLELNVPSSISVSRKGEVPLAVGFDNIDIGFIEKVSKEDASDSKELKDSIIVWIVENYNPKIEFEIISAFLDDGEEDLLSKFKISLNPRQEIKEKAYLFIGYPVESISFSKDYQQQNIDGGTYIALDDFKNIEFLIKESISVEELGAYISPEISAFGVEEKIIPEEIPKFNLGRFIFWISILLAVTLVLYIILQEWYRRHYENYLFKNRNDVYNLINFIYNARVGGLSDSDIRGKLKDRNWKGEQITYAFKKIDGKRTGMWEIPIFKFIENRRVRKELERRHAGAIEERFIKRPVLY